MAEELVLKVIGCVGELSVHQRESSLKVECFNPAESVYELYLTFEGTYKIFYCKFETRNSFSELQQTNEISISNTEFQVSVWKSLTFPFNVKGIFLSSKSLWTFGDDCLVDMKSHVENAVKVAESNKGNDSMDIDADEEFYLNEFESSLTISSTEKHKLQNKSVGLKCNLIDNSILACTKDLKTRSWHLTLLIQCLKSKELKSILLPDLPLTFDKMDFDVLLAGSKGNFFKPVITFIHKRDFSFQGPKESKNNVLHKILSTNPSSSNSVCLIGHPEGIVLYLLGAKSVHNDNFKVNSEIEQLYDMKQPIAGIHFLQEITGIEGSGFILIVGVLGKLVFFSAEKCLPNSEEITVKTESIHTASFNLPTSVQKHLAYQDYIFHVSENGDLWCSKFSKQTENNPQKKELSFLQHVVIMHRIADIVLLNELKGLFLLVTTSGSLYLSEYAAKKESINETSASLPSLMNEIMHQSSVLKNLAFTVSHQQKFFAALSTFASLKFSGIHKCNVSCSVTELDQLLKRFLVSINIQSSEKFDPEFWLVTVSLYSHYQQDSAMISKTVPFILDQSINIEVQESLLCLPNASPFPIHIEVGLLLVLPEKLKSTPCFEIVSKGLPLYIRIQTLILNELYFMKRKSPYVNRSTSALESSKSLLTNIHRLSKSKPISKLMKLEHQLLFSNSPQHFTFCLLTTSAQEIANSSSSGLSLVDEISHLLLQKSLLKRESGDSRLECRNQTMSLLVSAQENSVSISLHADSFLLLVGIRMAIMELLLSKQKKLNPQSSQYVQIPAAINTKCEKLSKDLLILLDQDIETKDFLERILFVYHNLRKEVSCVLPFC